MRRIESLISMNINADTLEQIFGWLCSAVYNAECRWWIDETNRWSMRRNQSILMSIQVVIPNFLELIKYYSRGRITYFRFFVVIRCCCCYWCVCVCVCGCARFVVIRFLRGWLHTQRWMSQISISIYILMMIYIISYAKLDPFHFLFN